jgi:hypothetical protein
MEIFVMLVGYIDESYSGENPPLTFGLSCVFAWGSEWTWVEMAWLKVLEQKNEELISTGRKPLKRFHATDMSNFTEEYEGWIPSERTDFTDKLIRKVFGKHELFAIGHTVSLRDIAETWPNYVGKEKHFAYYALLKINMIEIARVIEEFFPPGTQITLIHDRSTFDHVLQEAFNSLKNDPKYLLRDKFKTIVPMGWEDCVPLQLADLFAYEVMKEIHRLEDDVMAKRVRPRRKSLESLLARDSFFQTAKSVPRESLITIRESTRTVVEAKIVAVE